MLQLKNTERLMQNKAANEDFDSYAAYVRCGDFEHTFFSKMLMRTLTSILQAVARFWLLLP